jgi:hypothetical protein
LRIYSTTTSPASMLRTKAWPLRADDYARSKTESFVRR